MEFDHKNQSTKDDKSNLKEDLASFTEATTMHGLRFLSSRHTMLTKKIIWILVLLAMVIGLCFSFQDSIHAYYKYESVISTKLKRNNSLPLPAVSVCNFNLAKSSAFEKNWPGLIPYGLQAASLFNGLGLPGNDDTVELLIQIMAHIKFLPFLQEAGPTGKETFVECAIGVQRENCTKYISTFFTDSGMCFTFNSDEYAEQHGLLHTRLPGNIYGLKLTLDINPDDYLVSTFLSKGMQVLVHYPYQYPRMNLRRFVIEAGKEYFVSVQLQQNRILPTPYSTTDCITEDELSTQKKKISYGVKYSEDGCLAKCMTETLYNCDCNIMSTGDDACSLYDFYACGAKNLHGYLQYGVNCSECLPTCLSTHYDYKLSSADFPSSIAATYAKQREWPLTNITDFKHRYSRMFIYFETLQYTVIEQVPAMSLVQLLSNIGGQLGLYLGASLITLMEIIDFMVALCLKKCRKRNRVASSTTVRHISIIPNTFKCSKNNLATHH